MRKWGISPAKVLGLFVLLWSHSALAQDRTDLRPIRRLNVAPFYLGVEDKTELIQVINRYADDIRTGLSMAGYGQLSDQVIGEIRDGNLTETELPVGQPFHFMLFRHTVSGRDRNTGRQFVRGEVDVIRDLYWAGNAPVKAYTFRVEDQQYRYTFAIPFGPRGCSNLTLIERKPFPVCVLRISASGNPNCYTIDASASYATEDIVTVTVSVADASGNVLVTQDGRTAFEWCAPAVGTFTVRVVVTNREGITRECTDTIVNQPPPVPDNPPQCLLVVSPEDATTGQTVTIDATGASDTESCIQSNVVEIRDESGAVLLSANGNEVIFFKFRSRGTYTIVNTVTDCKGQVTVCEKTVTVTRKRGHFLVSLGGMFEKRTELEGDVRDALFDIGLIVQTDPWPDRQFIRAAIQTFALPPGATNQTFQIRVLRDGTVIGTSTNAVFEQMLPGPGNYTVEATSTITVDGQTFTDSEDVSFTVTDGDNETFSDRGDGTNVPVADLEEEDTHWYIPLKLGYAYELVSNVEAAVYGGVAIALDDIGDSALFADLELNYRGSPIMFGVGLGWWNFNHSEADNIDLLVNLGVIFAEGLFGSDSWTFLVQGRLPLNPEDDSLDPDIGDEYRIFFGIRLDF